MSDNGLLPRKPGEVFITQYLRPDARKRKGYISMGDSDEAIKLADEAATKLICAMEVLPAGDVVIYVHHKGQPEESGHIGIALNGPGPDGIANVLRNLVFVTLKDKPYMDKPTRAKKGRPNRRWKKNTEKKP